MKSNVGKIVLSVVTAYGMASDPGLSQSSASRPLWQACAHALDMNSHLNVERVTALIDNGKVTGADLERAYKDRGCIHEFLAEDTLAIAGYSKAVTLNPDDAEAYFIRGRTYGNARRYAQALADYNAALRLAPDDSETYYRRGHLFEDALHEHNKAVADYTASIRLDPGNPAAYEMRAIAYFNLGREADAAADRETGKRLKASPSNPIPIKRAAGEWE
jgi:tetratricopeptide (TPR) repeat protein